MWRQRHSIVILLSHLQESIHQVHVPFLFIGQLPFELEILRQQSIQSLNTLNTYYHHNLLTPSISYLSSLASRSFPPVATRVLSVRQPIHASNSCILRVKFSFSICNTWVFCSNSVIFLFFSSISASCLQCET